MLELCRWSEARPVLRSAGTLGDDEQSIEQCVADGGAVAWRVNGGSAYMLTRAELTDQGAELVIMCAAGRGMDTAMPSIIATARQGGFETIRFHTRRPSLGRLAARYGYRERERVYAVETCDGR